MRRVARSSCSARREDDSAAAPVASAMTGSVARMAFLLASLDTRPWTRVPEPSLSSPFIARSDGGAVSSGMDPCLRLSSLAVALVLACGAAARADADHAHARAASEVGQIVSLQAIVTRVQAEFTGSLVAVELEEDDAPWIYKVKLLTPAGAIVKLEYDARDGRLLRVKGRDAEPARRQKTTDADPSVTPTQMGSL